MKRDEIRLQLIAAVDRHWGIGLNNNLLFHISDDLKRFKALTENNIVIMGRKTFLSLPNLKPLPNRLNIVLTRDNAFCPDGVVVCSSLLKLNAILSRPENKEKTAYVCGGQDIYAQLLPYCHSANITHVIKNGKGDRFAPRISKMPGWIKAEKSPFYSENGLTYTFVIYKNLSPSCLPAED